MDYAAFLERLSAIGWHAPNRSYAWGNAGDWQIAFIRLGGKFQQPGRVAFVVCVRHQTQRNTDGNLVEHERNPNSFPFRLTIDDIQCHRFHYERKQNFQLSDLSATSDWSTLFGHLTATLPTWLRGYTAAALAAEISALGEPWYVERIWLESLPPL